MPTVGVIYQDTHLGGRIETLLKSAGFTVSFKIPVKRIKASLLEANVVVVAAESRNQDLIKQLQALHSDGRFVACFSAKQASSIQRLIDSGIDGIVWEARLHETLEATIRAVHAGQLVLPRDLRERVQRIEFTNREKQTLSMMIMGLTNREIANRLFVSENTVKSHLNTAYRKLGAHSRAEATHLISDPKAGLGTGILAITGPGLKRSTKS